MKKIVYYLPSIIFNVAETLGVFFIGRLLGLSVGYLMLILLTFATVRALLKSALHYKDWYKCLIWSILVFVSFFIVAKVNIFIAIFVSIFSGYILTEKGNIDIQKLERV